MIVAFLTNYFGLGSSVMSRAREVKFIDCDESRLSKIL